MNIFEAIARSAANKAENVNDNGSTIIVEQRYGSIHQWWFHVWCFGKLFTDIDLPGEADVPYDDRHSLETIYHVSKKEAWKPV
jgi:hypothetical protein